jgi:hypothetical protein
MAVSQETGILKTAETAVTAADELELARSIHGVCELFADMGTRPIVRVRDAAAFVGLSAQRVRRYMALHLAPQPIKELFLEGRLSGRIVELLHAVSTQNQLILARRCLEGPKAAATAERSLELDARTQRAKSWTDDALEFEATLRRAMDLIEPYVEAPRGRLYATFRGAGSLFGRRSLIELVERHIEELTMLKQVLEACDSRPMREGDTSACTVAANSS